MQVKCVQCGINFNKSPSQIEKTNNNFCNKSCAATFNNKKFPKRKPEGKCETCSKAIEKRNSFCSEHRVYNKKYFDHTTLREIKQTNRFQAGQWAPIRDQARRMGKKAGLTKRCSLCSYDKHIVVCHIKPISSFSKTATMGEVNATTNLIGLCPNHHWEFDHNLLSAKDKKFINSLQS